MHDEPARQHMAASGIPEKHHDELLSLKAEAEASNLDWEGLIEEILPIGIALLKRILARRKRG